MPPCPRPNWLTCCLLGGALASAAIAAEPSHAAKAQPAACSAAQWLVLSPTRCLGDLYGAPTSCAGLPRDCTPCRMETTYTGQAAPSLISRWELDNDGRLRRSEKTIGPSVTAITCVQVSATEVRCEGDGAIRRGSLEKERLVKWASADRETRYERDSAGRLLRAVTRVHDSAPRRSILERDAGEEPWLNSSAAGWATGDGGEPVTRWFLFSVASYGYDRDGRFESETERRAEGQYERTVHYDSQGRYVGTTVTSPMRPTETWTERVAWDSPTRAVRKGDARTETLVFDERGRLVSMDSPTEQTRVLYDCPR
jgi:hypothetical protein